VTGLDALMASSFTAPLVSSPAIAAPGTGAYRGWWWFALPHKEEA
jgi:hypothetical protein